MANARIYPSPNINISGDTGFDANSISNMMNQFSASKRAEAQLLMQQAQHKYQMDTIKKTENTTNAINEWSSKGLPWGSLAENPIEAFSVPLPSSGANFKGYKDYLASLDITADPASFMEASMRSNQAYMKAVAGQYNAIYTQLKANNPYASAKTLSQAMQENYSGTTVAGNMLRAGLDPVLALKGYDPSIGRETGWIEYGKSFFFEPEVENVGGQFKPKGVASVAVGGGAVVGGFQFKSNRADFLEQAEAMFKKSKNSKEFQAKYGMKKSEAFSGTKGEPVSSKALKKKANKFGRSQTWPSKVGKSGFAKGATSLGRGALPYAAGGMFGAKGGAALAEAFGGGELAQAAAGVTGGVAGAAGTKLTMTKVAKKLADPEVMKRIIPLLKKQAPKLAAKLGASMAGIVIPEGFSTAFGIAGLAWSAYDLVQLANSAPEIYAALAGD